MVRFIKGHGLGNDFLILEGKGLGDLLTPDRVRALCNRRTGVGADGVLIREDSPTDMPFMRIFNADGSEPEMCGNGLRVFALYLVQNLGFSPEDLRVLTPAGERRVQVRSAHGSSSGDICVDMGCAVGGDEELVLEYDVDGAIRRAVGRVVSMGNPHFVITDDQHAATAAVATAVGPKLETHSAFPEGANIEFVERVANNALRVFVWERGCGLTQACGTGACAAVAVAAGQGLVDYDEEITVTLPGGALSIRVDAESARVWMTGPAVLVAEGKIRL